jgi:phosphotransferase system IIA component
MTFLYTHPIQGLVRSISDTPDDVFSMKLLGDGFVVHPKNIDITSPISGYVDTIFPSKHIVIIKNKDVHVMLHLGFKARENIVHWSIKVSDEVTLGEPIGQLLPNFFKQSESDQSCNIVFLEKQSCYYHDTFVTCEDV